MDVDGTQMDDDGIKFVDTEFVDIEFVDMEGCFVVEGTIGIMRPVDDGVICDVIGVTPSDVIGWLEYGEL